MREQRLSRGEAIPVHQAAVLGGPPERLADTSGFLILAGLLLLVGLRIVPALYVALALILCGIATQLLKRAGRRSGDLGRWAPWLAVGLPLAAGIGNLILAGSVEGGVLWTVMYGLVGTGLWIALEKTVWRSRYQGALWYLPASGLEKTVQEVSRQPLPASTRAELLLHAGERQAAAGELSAARRSLEWAHARSRDLRARHLRSVIAFQEGDLETARSLTRELLLGPMDLEQGRQLRAWAAYLELASGCPGAAAALADAAVGPQAIAGEAWFEHCRLLQAWALLERGETGAAVELSRFVLANAGVASPYRVALHAMLSRACLAAGDQDAADRQIKEALRGGMADPFVVGQWSRMLAVQGELEEAERAGRRSVAAASGPFARATARVDLGHALLTIGKGEEAEAAFAEALREWPWLPAAEEGRVRRALAQGDAEEAERQRAEAARTYPEHRISLPQEEARLTG